MPVTEEDIAKIKAKQRLIDMVVSGMNKPVETPFGTLMNALGATRDKVTDTLSTPLFSVGPKPPEQDEKLKAIASIVTGALPYETTPGNAVMGLFGGPKATGYASAPRKFSSLADKMERFEISDEAMKFKEGAFPINPAGYKTRIGTRQGMKLGDIIEHEELFKNYPQFKDIEVNIDIGKMHDNSGSFSPHKMTGKPELTVRATSKEAAKGVISHEIQHAIQEYERFAKGTSPEAFATQWAERQKMSNSLDAILTAESKNTPVITIFNPISGENQIIFASSFPAYKELLLKELEKADKMVPLGPFETYKRTAGEIEARDAAFRRLYTDYERMTTQPGASQNIPLSEIITRFK